MAPSSSPLLTAVLLLASSAALAHAADGACPASNLNLKRIRVYMHETLTGPNATLLTSVHSPLRGGGATFGEVGVVDNELRDGQDRSRSSPLGRFQGLTAMTGLGSTPGMLSAVNVVFTAGPHAGSTLAMLGTIQDLRATVERTIVGGTGEFRMARGYSSMVFVPEATSPNHDVYMIDFFVDA